MGSYLGHYSIALLKWLTVFHAVCLAWIFFRAETFEDSWAMISSICFWQDGVRTVHVKPLSMMLVLAMPLLHRVSAGFDVTDRPDRLSTFQYITIIVSAILLMAIFAPGQSDPFIYFQF